MRAFDEGLVAGERVCSAAVETGGGVGKRGTEKREGTGSAEDRRGRDKVRDKSAEKRFTRDDDDDDDDVDDNE